MILEAPIADQWSVAGPAPWSGDQILDAPLQGIVGRQPDRVPHPSPFQGLIYRRHGERGVRPDHNGLPAPAVPINDGQENLLPSLRAVDVARSELRGKAVALWVEHEERVITHRFEMTVIGRLLLRPVDRAFGAVDVEDHPPRGRARHGMLNEVRVQPSGALVVVLLGEDGRLEPMERRGQSHAVSRRSREASIRNVGSSASRSASFVSSYPAKRL